MWNATGVHRLLHLLRSAATSPTRNARTSVVLGRLLGLAFVVCLGTGLYSHWLQEPLPWMTFATRPVWLYQLTQGVHVTVGIACVPLLLGKLHAVFPQLFQWPPVRTPLQLLERASIALFVASSILQLVTGLLNTYQWYPWPFPFRQVHFALSFVIVGSLVVHVGVKLPLIVRYWRARDSYDAEGRFVEPDAALDPARADFAAEVELGRRRATGRAPEAGHEARGLVGRLQRWIDRDPDTVDEVPDGRRTPDLAAVARREAGTARRERVSRRGFFAAVGAATGGVVLLTGGQSFTPLVPFNAFGARVRGVGPNDLPINRTAAAARVLETAMDPEWRLTVAAGATSRSFSADDLLAATQVDAALPISCVEGWSQTGHWRGVRLVDLVDSVGGVPEGGRLRITSLEERGGYRVTEMGREYVADPLTLVALELNGERLSIDHGYPARIIAPGRPGVLQTKWLSTIEVLS